ncbi:hypothetical protein Mapa_004517 [Marchantia paleacea]|nr:hypothetical protein Mapa_004517 [Marchantia paleacea]
MSKHVEKPVGVRSLIILCMLLSLLLVLVTVRPLEVLGSLAICRGDASHGHMPPSSSSPPAWTRVKVVPEWQTPAVVTDREYEKLHDESYGQPRRFVPMGTATFLFVHFSTHRVEPNSFAVVGMGAKALYLYSNPQFFCSWQPHDYPLRSAVHTNGSFIQPDRSHVSYGKQYTGTVVYCTFDLPVGSDGIGGHLVVSATHGTIHPSGLEDLSFVAKVEVPGEFNASHFRAPYELDHVYCGAPLYGSLSPKRVREWIAYHVRFLGERSHFFLYDAGGIEGKVMDVLRPWVAKGRVTIMNVRQGERYNSHYHNQFVVLNDCLFRSRSLAVWTWFFDVDEYMYIPPQYSSVNLVINEIESKFWGKRLQRISMLQRPMDHKHCIRSGDSNEQDSAWALEKLVYRRTQVTERGGQMDRKSVVRADSALAMGPHEPVRMRMPPGAKDLAEVTMWESRRLQYYHYHGTVNKKESELCHEFLGPEVNETTFDDVQHQFDDSMKLLAEGAKGFELETVGSIDV